MGKIEQTRGLIPLCELLFFQIKKQDMIWQYFSNNLQEILQNTGKQHEMG